MKVWIFILESVVRPDLAAALNDCGDSMMFSNKDLAQT